MFQPKPDPRSAMELKIAQERLRQARLSFNLALIATATSAGVSLLGAGLLLSNQVSAGTVTTAGGLVSSVGFVRLARDANDRLDKILSEWSDETEGV